MTRQEILVTGAGLLFILGLALFNFSNSQVIAHDIQRKNDLKHIAAGLEQYAKDGYGVPKSEDGKIVACVANDNTLRACSWGQDSIESTKSAYLKPLPVDPRQKDKGYQYVYYSNARDFQIYAHLERREDDEYNKKVEALNIPCGSQICNFGIASTQDALLDSSIRTYKPFQ